MSGPAGVVGASGVARVLCAADGVVVATAHRDVRSRSKDDIRRTGPPVGSWQVRGVWQVWQVW
ncbi:hypothetical protein [Streptomyces afghaniensis]|uniref:hypothetical protein n=1 Tax=Streptomyces afghaniensis TaxID=66865 RepID=UPI0037A7782F